MNIRPLLGFGALLLALLGLPAMAQSTAAPPNPDNANPAASSKMQSKHGHSMQARDCSQAPDPGACKAFRDTREQAHAACKDASGAQRRQCMETQMQNMDCSKAADPQRCEAHKAAHKACQGETGAARHRCVHDKMPPPDCSKAKDPQRCEQHQKARTACQDKRGAEQKACLHEQFIGK